MTPFLTRTAPSGAHPDGTERLDYKIKWKFWESLKVYYGKEIEKNSISWARWLQYLYKVFLFLFFKKLCWLNQHILIKCFLVAGTVISALKANAYLYLDRYAYVYFGEWYYLKNLLTTSVNSGNNNKSLGINVNTR